MRLFVTVGSMLPFDRLVQAVDAWAAGRSDCEVFAQIGEGARQPLHIASAAMLDPATYRERMQWADLIVSHVGMGTVIAAAELGKPLLLMPREVALREVTSAHQQASARWLAGRPGIEVVADEAGLVAALERDRAAGAPAPLAQASPRLVDALRQFADAAVGAAPLR
jgi:UDP-N-acetylglucosamine transferase subunit ALG13